MSTFEPEDEDDVAFHERFGGLRRSVVQVAHGLTDRIRARVAEAERPTPRLSDVLLGGLSELLNLVTRVFQRPPDDDDP